MRIAIDANSKLKTCLAAGLDPEAAVVEFEGKQVKVNSAAYGYENLVNSLVFLMEQTNTKPKDLIFVWDGANSSARRVAISPAYKSKRSNKPPQYYVQYQELREKIMGTFLGLGSIEMWQEKTEADDVLAFLAKNTEENLIIDTNDGDMTVLNGMNDYGAQVQVRIANVIGENKYGPWPHKLVTLYKSLVGDSSDGIAGCVGFGVAAWDALFAAYKEDGMFELLDVIANNKIDTLSDLCSDKNIKKIWEQNADVYKAYRLASLYPEWVNTLNLPLQTRAGMTTDKFNDDERLKKYRQQTRLVTAANYGTAYQFLEQQLKYTPEPAFDIETSTGEESDDWLEAQGDPFGVDVMGSKLTGFSITFGSNNQFTYYVSVDHKNTENVTMVQARKMIELLGTCKATVIQNTSFEGTVLYNAADEDGTLWRDTWKNNGYEGFIPRWLDTLFEGSYYNENHPLGLKYRSKWLLRYDQATYDDTVCKTGKLEGLPSGGRIKKHLSDDFVVKQYKMNELPATEVFAYGCDDTICTAALHNFYKLMCQLEHTYEVYKKVEIDASYLHALSFVQGVHFSLEKMNELVKIDDATYDRAWSILRGYLILKGWDGTVPPAYTAAISAKEIKQAYAITLGLDQSEDDEDGDKAEEGYHAEKTVEKPKDLFLSTRVRTPSKMVALAKELGHEHFAEQLQRCLDGQHVEFTAWVNSKFTGELNFKISNKQMQKLLYEVMELPVKVSNKPTDKMRMEGKTQGTPKTDALAIAYALQDAQGEVKDVLEAIKLVQMVKTRRSLYYSKYPYFVHWKTGLIHPSHLQCSTNTRRGASMKPNMQQQPKHPKIEGEEVRFREVIVPHHKNAVIVSLDEDSQEYRIMADYSKDANLLSCFVGVNLKSMHSFTGLGIMKELEPNTKDWSYETFIECLENKEHQFHKLAKSCRVTGKKVNFTTEYGAMAPKVAVTLLIEEEQAQKFIDAREDAFPVLKQWKEDVIVDAKSKGFVTTMMGAVRHLGDAFRSGDRWESSKAERQAVNTKVQGSAAEQTKTAESSMWRRRLPFKYDTKYIGPIHDECVWSVGIPDLQPFLVEAQACMTQKFASMSIPVESGLSFGPNFGQQIEIGFYPGNCIQKAMAELRKILGAQAKTEKVSQDYVKLKELLEKQIA